MTRRFALAAIAVSASVAAWSVRADAPALRYVGDPAADKSVAVVDSRAPEVCAAASLAGARCLAATDVLGPHERLAAFADIAWVLGSAGLEGSESVLVIGDDPRARDFVAGILYLMGQAHVAVLTRSIDGARDTLGPGRPRAVTRTAVWQAPARAGAVVVKTELRSLLEDRSPPVLLDGRDEGAYWGQTGIGGRGGHLPGADSLPAERLRAGVARGDAVGPRHGNTIVYARHAVDGIAFLTLIVAGTGVPARVYPGGWAEWSADGTLAVDQATYLPPVGQERRDDPAPRAAAAAAVAGLFGGLVVATFGFWILRRRKVV